MLARIVLAALIAAPLAAHPINETTLGGVAIEGHDAVAYFTQGAAVEGSKQFEHEWMDSRWRFASAEHRDLFAADPAKYAPQYGGFCAFGISRGYAVGVDPKAWSIVDSKLYLNYSLEVRATWLEDVDGYVARADANWPAIAAKESGR